MDKIQDIIRHELELEAESIRLAAGRIGMEVVRAVEIILHCSGKVIVTGMGKTGIIARKIAATLASTGTTAIFLHAAEGIHGDLGILNPGDVVIAVSYSGNTSELIALIPYLKFHKLPIIALTGNNCSQLAQNADVIIDCSVPKEYEPFGLVPTSSTTVALAIGDALAIALLRKRNFQAADFARFHPGGTIGKKLILRVNDLMHRDEANPVVSASEKMDKVILEMTSKGLGCTSVIDHQGKLCGIITDGDLRRILTQPGNILEKTAQATMTRTPRFVKPETLAVEALNQMEECKITMLPVLDEAHQPVGMLHMHDLINAGVVG
ncbi:MAG: KpsF/GutQ family sugar-phosphate isomerase [Candidatus Cloacimonetes bacterium]|nr:KpsF/GutQ family sugar-phosphate isomerase [Candidatus Cloacimonadota bacterium]